jgi:DUF4097 and DUF4098 domain-containing protein YvlB
MAKNTFTHNLSEPLGNVTAAKIFIDNGDGNMTLDGLTSGEPVLASGTLEYLEKQGLPSRTLDTNNGQATLTLKAGSGRQTWLHLPWQTCNGATIWQVHLNPGVEADITAHSGGGNVKIDLAGMAVTRLAADTGGGNMDVALPEDVANLSLNARSGAGNVTVRVPGGIAARIQASTGLGKVIVDGRFSKIDDKTYQSPDYDTAAKKVEITLHSGAGNVSVTTK